MHHVLTAFELFISLKFNREYRLCTKYNATSLHFVEVFAFSCILVHDGSGIEQFRRYLLSANKFDSNFVSLTGVLVIRASPAAAVIRPSKL